MRIQHHPDKSTLLAYAAGTLNEAFSYIISAHSHHCKQCRLDIENAETIGANLINNLSADNLSSNSFDQLWDKIDSNHEIEYSTQLQQQINVDSDPLLSIYRHRDFDSLEWKFLAPGIQQVQFKQLDSDNGTVRLFKIKPGVQIPHHTHRGNELTLVLDGSYEDELGIFKPGDLSDLDQSHCHRPRVNSNKDCICLIATDDKLKFTSSMNNLLQPLLGI